MSKDYTIVKTMIGCERVGISYYGNPRYRMMFDDGLSALTVQDAGCAYGLENRGNFNVPLEVTFTARGTVRYFRIVK